MELLLKGVASSAVAYGLHYASAKAQTHYCIPDGWTGFLQGLVTVGSPACQATQNIMASTQVTQAGLFTVGVARFLVDLATSGFKA